MKHISIITPLLTVLGLTGCGAKVDIQPLQKFDVSRYMGVWYEIARLDHTFEHGLEQVTATYVLNPNGTVGVTNRGYLPSKGKWKSAEAVAKTTSKCGQFKVYFVPLIGGDYQIAYLSDGYSGVVVSGGTRDYLWFLSRTPTISSGEQDMMLQVAKNLGYDTSKLIFVKQ